MEEANERGLDAYQESMERGWGHHQKERGKELDGGLVNFQT
jgi:hypothetical protein